MLTSIGPFGIIEKKRSNTPDEEEAGKVKPRRRRKATNPSSGRGGSTESFVRYVFVRKESQETDRLRCCTKEGTAQNNGEAPIVEAILRNKEMYGSGISKIRNLQVSTPYCGNGASITLKFKGGSSESFLLPRVQ
ncbi:unnamed protein product [Victoria cruziana]